MKKEEYAKDILNNYKERSNEYKKRPRKTKINTSNLNNVKFCNYLKRERIDLGLTQKEMAIRIGIPYKTYVNCENGNRPVITKRLSNILTASECKILDKNGDIIFE